MSANPDFDGKTYVRELDHVRLTGQNEGVYDYISDGLAHTLPEMSEALGYPTQWISVRIRDLRKEKFGGYNIQHRRRTTGTYEYRLFGVLTAAPEPEVHPTERHGDWGGSPDSVATTASSVRREQALDGGGRSSRTLVRTWFHSGPRRSRAGEVVITGDPLCFESANLVHTQ